MATFWTRFKNNPVLVNELRSRMRGRRAFWVLGVYLLVLSGLMFTIYMTVYQDTMASSYYYAGQFQQSLEAASTLGKAIFYGTNLLLLFGVTLVAPAFTASAIVSEKERQTFDLLVITALPARDIVLGKLSAVLVFIGLLLLATLPFQGMAYFFGGVAFSDILLAMLLLLLTTLLYCSWGLFVSSFARTVTIANMINYVAIVPMLLGVPFLLFLVGVMSAGAAISVFQHPPFLVALVLSYAILLFVSINPVSMGIASAIFVQETGSYVFSVEKFFDANIPIISPWVVFVVFAVVVSYILIKATISRVARVPRI